MRSQSGDLPAEKIDDYEKALGLLAALPPAARRSETIALVIPPSPQIPTPGREFLISGPFEGFTAVATLIKKLGYNLKVVDCRPGGRNTAEYLLGEIAGAEAVGIAAYCDSFVFLRDVSRAIKKSFPEKFLFLGGPLVTSLPGLILTEAPVDCAVLGEAELTLMELLDTVFGRGSRDLSSIKGLAVRTGGGVKLTAPRPQINDLDKIPFPDYTVWPNYKEIVKAGQIIISSTRGCPHACSFCYKTIPALRQKSLGRFEAEIAHLKETTGFNYTWLNDLTFNANVPRAMKLAELLFKHGVKYHCFTRVTGFPRELAETLKRTGCEGVWFGVESYDQRVLDLNRKHTTIPEIDLALKTAREAGLEARGLFIVGLPGETAASLEAMTAYIRKGDFIPLVKYLVPFPGTAVYDEAVAAGRIKDTGRFLEELSVRRVGDFDDEIINMTSLDEGLLREHFHKIWELTRAKEGN